MLIVLPPSEGKALPARGRPSTWPRSASPVSGPATGARRPARALHAATGVRRAGARARADPGRTWSHRNAGCATAPTARADRVYSGVLYDALDLALSRRPQAPAPAPGSRSPRASSGWCGRATGSRRTGSPATSRCPASGPSPACGATALGPALTEAAGARAAGRPALHDVRRLLAAAGRPRAAGGHGAGAPRGRRPRKVVSHFNKATKGRIVRAAAGGRRRPADAGVRRPAARLGWKVEVGAGRRRTGTRLDVVVSEV